VSDPIPDNLTETVFRALYSEVGLVLVRTTYIATRRLFPAAR
jgi:hypothetical protein